MRRQGIMEIAMFATIRANVSIVMVQANAGNAMEQVAFKNSCYA